MCSWKIVPVFADDRPLYIYVTLNSFKVTVPYKELNPMFLSSLLKRFLQFLASRNTLFNLSNFLDKTGSHGASHLLPSCVW